MGRRRNRAHKRTKASQYQAVSSSSSSSHSEVIDDYDGTQSQDKNECVTDVVKVEQDTSDYEALKALILKAKNLPAEYASKKKLTVVDEIKAKDKSSNRFDQTMMIRTLALALEAIHGSEDGPIYEACEEHLKALKGALLYEYFSIKGDYDKSWVPSMFSSTEDCELYKLARQCLGGKGTEMTHSTIHDCLTNFQILLGNVGGLEESLSDLGIDRQSLIDKVVAIKEQFAPESAALTS